VGRNENRCEKRRRKEGEQRPGKRETAACLPVQRTMSSADRTGEKGECECPWATIHEGMLREQPSQRIAVEIKKDHAFEQDTIHDRLL